MHKLSLALCLLASVIPSLAAVPTSSVVVQKYDGDVNEGVYIVKVRDGAQKATVLSGIASLLGGDNKVTHDWDPEFLNAFAGEPFHPGSCVALRPNQIVIGNFGDNIVSVLLSSMDVEYIAEDGIMKTSVDQYVELRYLPVYVTQICVSEPTRRGIWLVSARGPNFPSRIHTLWTTNTSITTNQVLEWTYTLWILVCFCSLLP
jgi:hypothetical protein